MAVVPGLEPIQDPNQGVEPFNPLPTEQIASSTRRITDRLQKVRGAHADLMAQMAEQEVLPDNQQAFELATREVRDRLRKLSESDRFFNKLPQVRREARRFAKVAKGFKQNKANIQKSLKNLEEAEGLTDSHRAVMRRRIMRNAGVKLTEDRMVDPDSISGVRNIRDAQDPREFLDERLSKLEERTVHQRSSGDGVIRKSSQDVLSFDRLQGQGLRELGFALQNPDGEVTRENLRKVSRANPEVERWMDRQRDVYSASIANKMRSEGKNPEENTEEFRKKVDQAIKDEVLNMVNIVSGRHTSGDINPEVTIKSDPRVDDDGESTDTGPFGGATVNPGITIANEQARKIRDKTKENYFNRKFGQNGNENITRNEYEQIDEMIGGSLGEGDLSTRGIGLVYGLDPKSTNTAKARERFGEATLEAYKKIKRGEKNIDTSLGEFAIQQRSFDFTDKAKERNEVERNIVGEPVKNLKSPQLDKEQMGWMLKDENRFALVDVATDGSWFRIKPKNIVDMPGGENLFGFGAPKPDHNDTVIIRNVGKGTGEGTAQQGFLGAITKGLDERARKHMAQAQKVAGQSFGDEWTRVKEHPDVSIRLGGIEASGDFTLRKQAVEPRFVSKVRDEKVTFGKMGEALLNNDVSGEKLFEFSSGMAQAANKLPTIRRLISDPESNVNPITPGSMAQDLRDWFGDRENMSEKRKKAVRAIMNSPIPASESSTALQWAEQFKKLN